MCMFAPFLYTEPTEVFAQCFAITVFSYLVMLMPKKLF